MGLEKINEYRKKVGISIEDLSLKSGVPVGTLSKITAGITKDPKLETVRSIAYALGITLDDLEDNPRFFNPTMQEISLLSSFGKLNEIGQEEAIKRVEELTYLDKYIKNDKIINIYEHRPEFTDRVAEDSAEYPDHLKLNAARPLKGSTEEDRKHDDEIMDDPNF